MVDFRTKSGNRYYTEHHGMVKLLYRNGVVMGRLHRVIRLEKGEIPVIDYYRDNNELWTFCTTAGDEVEEIYEDD